MIATETGLVRSRLIDLKTCYFTNLVAFNCYQQGYIANSKMEESIAARGA